MVLGIVGVVVVIGLGFGVNYAYRFYDYKKKMNNVELQEINLATIKDGKYEGDYDASIVSAKVKVTVKDHQITAIDLVEHRNERGEKAEVIIDDVIKKQSIKIDTVSGATNSSNTILKAVEDALVVQP